MSMMSHRVKLMPYSSVSILIHDYALLTPVVAFRLNLSVYVCDLVCLN